VAIHDDGRTDGVDCLIFTQKNGIFIKMMMAVIRYCSSVADNIIKIFYLWRQTLPRKLLDTRRQVVLERAVLIVW